MSNAVMHDQAARTATIRLTVADIHCWGCADLLELAIEAYPGVESAPVYLSGHCSISFRPGEVGPAELVAAINGRGYAVHNVEVEGIDASTLTPMPAVRTGS